MSRSFRVTEPAPGLQPTGPPTTPQPVQAQPAVSRRPVSPGQQLIYVPYRRRRRWGLRLLVTLIVLAGLFVAANIGTRVLAGHQVASVVKSRTGAREVSAEVGSFPWLVPLLSSGTVSSAVVRLHEVPTGRLDLTTVTVDASDVHIARQLLFSDRRVRITSIGSADVTATISSADLGRVTGHLVVISGSRVEVKVGPVTVPVALSVSRTGVLSVGVQGAAVVRLPLTTSGIVPACPMRLVVARSSIGLSCHVAPVPQAVINALN